MDSVRLISVARLTGGTSKLKYEPSTDVKLQRGLTQWPSCAEEVLISKVDILLGDKAGAVGLGLQCNAIPPQECPHTVLSR
jgi:hypothetical protein